MNFGIFIYRICIFSLCSYWNSLTPLSCCRATLYRLSGPGVDGYLFILIISSSLCCLEATLSCFRIRAFFIRVIHLFCSLELSRGTTSLLSCRSGACFTLRAGAKEKIFNPGPSFTDDSITASSKGIL